MPLDPDTFDEVKDSHLVKRVTDFHKVCTMCYAFADKTCGKCKKVDYCSKEHQELDWKFHKAVCLDNQKSDQAKPEERTAFLFPEYELVIETEQVVAEKKEKERSEEERMQDYNKFVKAKDTGDVLSKQDLDEIDKAAKKPDKAFKLFKRRVEQNPDQVLRYQRGGRTLWATSDVPNEKDIPHCSCGAPRAFEFQIMPHLLSYLDVDALENSIDWATVAVFTCSKSCASPGYISEFVVKQDFIE